MSSKEQRQQLLETIDAVLAECGKDPRRRSTRRSTRPAWSGTRWWRDEAVMEPDPDPERARRGS